MKKLFQRVKYVCEHNYMTFVIRFAKVNLFNITFECLITVYILELFAIMTKFFLVDPTSIPKLLLIIVFPLILEIVVCCVFGVMYTLVFLNTVYKFSLLIEKKHTNYTDYVNITKQYRKRVIVGHSIGTLCYTVSTILIPLVLVNMYPDSFTDPKGLILATALLGALMGLVWNITGYYRNQRILWHKLLPMMKFDENRVIEDNFRLFIKNIICNFISIILLFTLSVIIILNLHPAILNQELLNALVTQYNFFLVAYVGLIAFYIKMVFASIYSFKHDNNSMFPSLKQLFHIQTD